MSEVPKPSWIQRLESGVEETKDLTSKGLAWGQTHLTMTVFILIGVFILVVKALLF